MTETHSDNENTQWWRKHTVITESHSDDGNTVMTETYSADGNTQQKILQEKVTRNYFKKRWQEIISRRGDKKRLPSILLHKSE